MSRALAGKPGPEASHAGKKITAATLDKAMAAADGWRRIPACPVILMALALIVIPPFWTAWMQWHNRKRPFDSPLSALAGVNLLPGPDHAIFISREDYDYGTTR
jgi:hypothetical protein